MNIKHPNQEMRNISKLSNIHPIASDEASFKQSERKGKNPLLLKIGKKLSIPKTNLQNECKGKGELSPTIFKEKGKGELGLEDLGAYLVKYSQSVVRWRGSLRSGELGEGGGGGCPARWSFGRRQQQGGSEG